MLSLERCSREFAVETENNRVGQWHDDAQYRQLVRTADEAALLTAADGNIALVNDHATALLGYSADAIMKIPIIDLYHPDDREMVIDRVMRSLAGEYMYPAFSARLMCKDGEVISVQIIGLIIQWQRQPAFLIFIKDMTLEEKLEARLQQVEKLQSLGTLAGGIAHDFNNLLSVIQGCVSLIRFDKDLSPTHQEKLKTIEAQVQSGAKLVKGLLGYARKGKCEVKAFDLQKLVQDTAVNFGRTRKDITIHVGCSADLPIVKADPSEIEQVLLNLMVNSGDAMPDGGELNLRISRTTGIEIMSRSCDLEYGSYLQLSVIDTGIGMDKTTQEQVFEPFFTTKEMGKGTGLGLASAYGIVKRHGGDIVLSSRPGIGTIFDVYLPASELPAADQETPEEEILKGTGTILLVDDESKIVHLVGTMLKLMGYDVITAESGEEAIEEYAKTPDTIDLVILDMIMPHLGGRETYQRLKAINPQITVLLSSGYSLEGQAEEILEDGCNGFLQKPYNMTQLSFKIRELLETPLKVVNNQHGQAA